MKYKLIFVLVFVYASACRTGEQEDSWKITISGKVGHPGKGPIVIQEIMANGNGLLDTIQLNDDYTFSREITLSEPGYYRLNFFNRQRLDVILYKSDVEVTVDGSDPQGFAEVKGSPDMDLIKRVQDIGARLRVNPEVARINQAFADARENGDNEQMAALRESYMALFKVQQDSIAELLERQEPSLGLINILRGGNVLNPDDYFYVYSDAAQKLSGDWATYRHAKEFIEMVNRMEVLAVGQRAPEIALPSPDGNIVKLSSLRGKYVLVDFWAKWCGPCRQENPNLVRTYQRYKDLGFEIYGVSLDRTKDDWLQAIRDDHLTWTHVSDLKFWDSEAAKTYNVDAIPFTVLLDPEGKIIAKNLRGPELEQKLEELFGS